MDTSISGKSMNIEVATRVGITTGTCIFFFYEKGEKLQQKVATR